MIVSKVTTSNICKVAVYLNPITARHLHSTSPALSEDKNYYKTLQVSKTATTTEVKEAYYKLSKVCHPDVARDQSSLKMFRDITEAYDVLSNLKKRKQYDVDTGIAEEYDTTKTKFYTSLYADKIKRGGFAPDYDLLKQKRTKQENFEKTAYADRMMERKTYKYQFYGINDNYHFEYYGKRIDVLLLLGAASYIFYHWDMTYDLTSAIE